MCSRYTRRALGIVLALAALASLHAAQDAGKTGKEGKKPPLRERERQKPATPKKGKEKAKAPAPRQREFQSGPQVGQEIPGPFTPFIVNGKRKDRYHSLVIDYGIEPVVLVFAREPADGKDAELSELLKQLDEAVARHERQFLHGAVVFLSPDAPASPAGAGDNADKLVKEAAARTSLNQRMQARADKVKNITLAYFPVEGPRNYKISDQAEVTVLFYRGFKVEANLAFKAGELQPDNVKQVIETIDRKLAPGKKSASAD